MLIVTTVYMMWAAVDLDYNDAPVLIGADPVFQIVEHIFCILFLSEQLVRFLAFRRKKDALWSPHFMLDTVLLASTVFETWGLPLILATAQGDPTITMRSDAVLFLASSAKLIRLLRLLRLVRSVPELRSLSKAVLLAARPVGLMLCLAFLLIFAFSLALVRLASGTEVGTQYFRTVPESLATVVLRICLLDGLSELVVSAGRSHGALVVLVIVLALFCTTLLLNVMLASVVQAITAFSNAELKGRAAKLIRDRVIADMSLSDGVPRSSVMREDLEELLAKPQAACALDALGVDVSSLVRVADVAALPWGQLSGRELLDLTLQLRGAGAALVTTTLDVRSFFQQELRASESRLSRLVCRQSPVNQLSEL